VTTRNAAAMRTVGRSERRCASSDEAAVLSMRPS
jgi:hypothetical protein